MSENFISFPHTVHFLHPLLYLTNLFLFPLFFVALCIFFYSFSLYINIKILQAAVGKQPHWNHTIFSDRAAIPEVSLSETVSSPQKSHFLITDKYLSLVPLLSISFWYFFVYNIFTFASRCRKSYNADSLGVFAAQLLCFHTSCRIKYEIFKVHWLLWPALWKGVIFAGTMQP